MVGITSYGGYIPKYRLNRMSIFQNMEWFAPAIIMVAQGERSFCNWDEDALTMAVTAAQACLNGTDKKTVEAVYLCSTTLPFSDRSNAGIVKTALNLRDNIIAQDMTATLRAGTTGLITALTAARQPEKGTRLVVATDKRETKGAYFYEMWFGDGAAALLVGDTDVIAEFQGSYSVSVDFVDHYRGSHNKYDYMWEERWVRDEGYSKIIPEAVNGLFNKLSLSMADVDKLVFPCFFKSEHRNIARKLGAEPEKVVDNLHEVCGETGTAHPLVMFVNTLEKSKPGDRILLVGFGQGCDALYFRVTEQIRDLSARSGISGSLANKKTTENYAKFLRFRDLLQTEMGIRAEFPTQTAMTVLWRNRRMLLGMIGGKCTKCGTPQFPRMNICVNPQCLGVNTQEDYEFSDVPAVVKSFTGDLLAVSLDPPAIYGMVQFDGGGRFMADFTDCELSDVRVGQKAVLAFRKRYTDRDRGFTGYFWKAIPLPEGSESEPIEESSIEFSGQVAVVTGAGGGLGRQYALELARRGAKVVVNDLGGARDGSGMASTAPADCVVDEIKASGGEAVACYDSVSSPEGGKAIVEKAIASFGRIDILINNAGILRDKTLARMEPEDWKAVMAVHLDGAYNVSRQAFIKMRGSKYGRIIFTTSASGLYGNFGQTNYSAAKMGLIGFMNTLKLEGEKYGIAVNAVAPIAATRLTEDLLPPELSEKLKPEHVVPLVIYLSSRDCDCNGMIFNAGGGFFNRVSLVTGRGVVVGDGIKIPSPEELGENWDQINDLSSAMEYYNAALALGSMLEAFGPGADSRSADPTSTVSDIFKNIPEAFQADKSSGLDVVFQFKITGPKGGEWFVVVRDQNCETHEGQHSKPTTTIMMSDKDFMALIKGEIKAIQAYTSGKLKVEGDLMKSQLIEKLFKF